MANSQDNPPNEHFVPTTFHQFLLMGSRRQTVTITYCSLLNLSVCLRVSLPQVRLEEVGTYL